MYDLCIIGAGPAGSTMARLAPRHLRVLLVDERSLDRSDEDRGKLCGGLLAPAAQRELARQGLGVPHNVLRGPQLFAVRTIDLQVNLERSYQRFYTNIDRPAFDRWLSSLIPDNVEQVFGWRAVSLERDGDATTVHFTTREGGKAGVRASLVIGADGASSFVRRTAFVEAPALPTYVAIQAEFEGSAREESFGAVFDPTLTDYYGWTIPKAGSVLVGLALPVGDGSRARFDEFVEVLRRRGLGIGAELTRSACRVARPRRPSQLFAGDDRALLVGEAAGLISPSSAEGISYALRSSAALASALSEGIEGSAARYRRACSAPAAEVIVKMVKASAIYGARSRRAIMRSGIGALSPDRLGGTSALIGELLAP